jgi:TRAP-type transport system periplasmic protein
MNKKVGKVATFFVGTLMASGAQAADLIAAHGFGPSHAQVKHGLTVWQECVTKATNGDIKFQNFPSGQISGHKDGTHSLKAGIAQVVGIPPAYESDRFPLNILIQLPGAGKSAVHITAAYRKLLDTDGPIKEEWTALDAVPLLSMLSAPYQLLTSGEPLDSMEKLKGKKIRTAAGPMTYAVESLGATPVDMGTPDMYLGLQRGTIDGTILAMTSAPAYNLHEVVKSISTNGAFSSAHTVWAMDGKAFKALPAGSQKAVLDCGLEVEKSAAVIFDEEAKTISADYAAKGVTFYAFPPEMKAEIDAGLSTVAGRFVADLEGRGLPAQKAYDMMVQAAKDTMPSN